MFICLLFYFSYIILTDNEMNLYDVKRKNACHTIRNTPTFRKGR